VAEKVMLRTIIDWDENRMSIPEPKVEHHEGRGVRSCPIFPELRPILDEAFEIFGDKSEYVVAAPLYRAAANTAMGWKYSPRIAQQSYLLVTEDDFAKAPGVAKVVVSPPAFCPKRSILAGLVKFLAVGCGLNEIAPSADSSGT